MTDRYFQNPQTNTLYFYYKIKIIKEKCPSVVDNRSLHSNELFIAMVGSQARHDFHESSLNPQGLIRSADLKKRSKERVVHNSKIDNL